jgi:selenide,water dikinase
MLVSNRGAAAILTHPSVNAVTDVTGFGLLGHLENILADDQGACIELAALPTLPGVDQLLAEDAVLSTADPKNRQMVMRQVIDADSPWAIRRPLLFDPQTAGGLLLSVTAHAADDLVEQLREAGFSHAGIIGAVTEFGDQIEV